MIARSFFLNFADKRCARDVSSLSQIRTTLYTRVILLILEYGIVSLSALGQLSQQGDAD